MAKEQSIETLRGIAIISIVAFHVIGNSSRDGLQFADDSLWQYLSYSLKYLRLPLFSALSGFVYSMKPIERNGFIRFLKGKSRRILLPFISVSSLQYLIGVFLPQVNNAVELQDMWLIYFYPYAQFWFLQALFIIFIVISILEKLKITTDFRWWLLTLLCAITMLVALGPVCQIKLFKLCGCLYLFPFFLLGMGLQRFPGKILQKHLPSILIIFIGGLGLQQLNWYGLVSLEMQQYGPLSVVVGISGISLLFRIRRPITFLARVGHFSYCIYLFHIFGTAGSRIMLRSIGFENTILLFVCGVIAGVGVPVIIELVLLRSLVTRRVFLGLK